MYKDLANRKYTFFFCSKLSYSTYKMPTASQEAIESVSSISIWNERRYYFTQYLFLKAALVTYTYLPLGFSSMLALPYESEYLVNPLNTAVSTEMLLITTCSGQFQKKEPTLTYF